MGENGSVSRNQAATCQVGGYAKACLGGEVHGIRRGADQSGEGGGPRTAGSIKIVLIS